MQLKIRESCICDLCRLVQKERERELVSLVSPGYVAFQVLRLLMNEAPGEEIMRYRNSASGMRWTVCMLLTLTKAPT